MADSERAAEVALAERIPTGLHLNFIELFSGHGHDTDSVLIEHHRKIVEFLKSSPYSQILYNPSLGQAFEYVFRAQVDEFFRLYNQPPTHFDGHKHMHLCTNMLVSCPIPLGQKVRRSLSFEPGEKGFINRGYRNFVNLRLARRYRITDYFFALSQQLPDQKFTRVCNLALDATVELMTHPAVAAEEAFLKEPEYEKKLQGVSKGTYVEL